MHIPTPKTINLAEFLLDEHNKNVLSNLFQTLLPELKKLPRHASSQLGNSKDNSSFKRVFLISAPEKLIAANGCICS